MTAEFDSALGCNGSSTGGQDLPLSSYASYRTAPLAVESISRTTLVSFDVACPGGVYGVLLCISWRAVVFSSTEGLLSFDHSSANKARSSMALLGCKSLIK